MSSFQFIHTADLHLGAPFVGLHQNNPRLAQMADDATYAAFDTIIQLAISRKVLFVLFAGDIYDADYPNLKAQLHFREGISQLDRAGIASCAIRGNHDHGGSVRAKLEFPDSYFEFAPGANEPHLIHRHSERSEERTQTKNPPELERPDLGDPSVATLLQDDVETIAAIYGYSYPQRAVTENILRHYKPRTEGQKYFRIGMLHGNVGGDLEHDNYAPCSVSQLKEIDIDYWALGHVHQAKVLSEAPAIAYSGTPQGLSPRETGRHGCYLVTAQEHRCAIEFIATDSIRWMDLQYSITEISTEEELLRALEDLLTGQREKENCALIARIDLAGRGLLHRSLQRSGSLQEIQDYLHQQIPDDIFIDRLRNRTLPDFDVEKKRQENNILGDFLRLCDSVNSDAEMRAKVLLALSDARDHPEIRSALDIHGSAEAENWLLHQLPKWLKQAEVEGADLLLAEDES